MAFAAHDHIGFGDTAAHGLCQDLSAPENAAAKKNSICVLMHDTTSKHTTVEALPEIIVGLKKMGYTFEKLDEKAFGYHHTVKN